MKFLIFIRGESDLRGQLVTEIMNVLNNDTRRAVRVSLEDYGPLSDKAAKKNAAALVKKQVHQLINEPHEETYIIVDSPNKNPQDWIGLFDIAESLNTHVNGIGIQLGKNEQPLSEVQKIKKDPNLHLFKAMMYKYEQVENEQDIDLFVKSVEAINSK